MQGMMNCKGIWMVEMKGPHKLQVISKGKIEKNLIIGKSKARGIKKIDVMLRITRVGSPEQATIRQLPTAARVHLFRLR